LKPQVVGALQELFFSPPRPQGTAAEQQHERRNTTRCTVSMTPASSGMHHAAAGTADVSCHRRWCVARFGSFRGRSRVGTDEVGRPTPRGPTLGLRRAEPEQWLSSSSSPRVPRGDTHRATNFRRAFPLTLGSAPRCSRFVIGQPPGGVRLNQHTPVLRRLAQTD
jgi:hypothetical protein